MKIRLTSFRAQGFRSLADLTLTDLPEVVLLYGNNDVGKSNILRAIGAWFGITRMLALDGAAARSPTKLHETFELPRAGDEAARLLGTDFLADFRHGHLSYELDGSLELVLDDAATLAYRFRYRIDHPQDSDNVVVRVLTAWWAGDTERSVLTGDHLAVLALRTHLGSGWQHIAAERTLRREVVPQPPPSLLDPLDSTGQDFKVRAFLTANATDAALRARYRQRFQAAITGGPFRLEAPEVALDSSQRIELFVGASPIGSRGSGVRQWVLMAGMLALGQPAVAGIEEPEAHLSHDAQAKIADLLRAWVESSELRPHQLFITTHSEAMIAMSKPGRWFRVSMVDGETQVSPQTDPDAVPGLAGVAPMSARAGGFRLGSGGWVRLSDEVVEHLAAEPGTLLFAVPDEQRGSVRIFSETGMDQELG